MTLQFYKKKKKPVKSSSKSTPQMLLGLFELTNNWGLKREEGLSEIVAAELAIKHINQLKILSNYTLKLIVNNTMCDPGVGIDRFFHAVYSNKSFIMLLGSSCSNVTESLAHVVPYWNIIQFSFGSISPILSDRKKFPLFFRTVSADSSHNLAKIQFVKRFGWKVVATFCQSENEYVLPLNNLISDFESANISCPTTVTFSLDNYKEQLMILKKTDIRIIIALMSAEASTLIFCEIYHLKMFGFDYVWILQERDTHWWQDQQKSFYTCKKSQLKQATNGIIQVLDYNEVETITTVSGIDSHQFYVELKRSTKTISKYAKYSYDAVWAMALGLQNENIIFKQQFSYKQNDMVSKFIRKMNSLHFIGISGPLKFLGSDRIGNSIIRQLQNDELRDIAIFNSTTNKIHFKCKTCHSVIWSKGKKPIAQRILKISHVHIPKSLFYSIVFTCLMGILFSLVFLYFNLRFRRMKSVKLSSPKLNNVAAVGCILVYISVAFMGVNRATSMNKYYVDEVCTIHIYLLSAGFSLSFGSMFAKTYRVHRIFSKCGAPSNRMLKDQQLIGIIFIPLLIDASILSLWIMFDPIKRELYNLTLEISREDRGVVYQPQVEVCRSQNTVGWFIAIYGYKGLILIMGAFMAWETRHIKVQALNDSQHIGICVYIAIFTTIIIVLTSFINEYIVFSYIAKAISLLTTITITLFLLFLPELISVFGSKQTIDPVMESMGFKIECNTRRFIINDPKEQILRLEIQNKVYKCELAALDMEISRLENLLHFNKKRRVRDCGIFTIFNDTPLHEKYSSWPLSQLFSSSEQQQKFNTEKQVSFNKAIVHWNAQTIDNKKRGSHPVYYHGTVIEKMSNLIRAKSDTDFSINVDQ